MPDITDGNEYRVTWQRGDAVVAVVSMVYDDGNDTIDVSVDDRHVATLDVR